MHLELRLLKKSIALSSVLEGGDSPNLNIKEEGWAEFLEQLIRHEAENHDQDAQFDPVKMGIA